MNATQQKILAGLARWTEAMSTEELEERKHAPIRGEYDFAVLDAVLTELGRRGR